MIVTLYDEAGRVIVAKRVRTGFPAQVRLPGAGHAVAVGSVGFKSTGHAIVIVDGEAVREHRETFSRPLALQGGDGLQFDGAQTTESGESRVSVKKEGK